MLASRREVSGAVAMRVLPTMRAGCTPASFVTDLFCNRSMRKWSVSPVAWLDLCRRPRTVAQEPRSLSNARS